jgi:hypothetical protein
LFFNGFCHFWFRVNQSLFLLVSAACLAEKQHIHCTNFIVFSLTRRSTTVEPSTITIISPMRFLIINENEYYVFYDTVFNFCCIFL